MPMAFHQITRHPLFQQTSMATEVARSHSHPRVSFEKNLRWCKNSSNRCVSLWKNLMNPTVGYMDFMNQSRKKSMSWKMIQPLKKSCLWWHLDFMNLGWWWLQDYMWSMNICKLFFKLKRKKLVRMQCRRIVDGQNEEQLSKQSMLSLCAYLQIRSCMQVCTCLYVHVKSVWMYTCTGACMYDHVCMHACMQVCMCTFHFLFGKRLCKKPGFVSQNPSSYRHLPSCYFYLHRPEFFKMSDF